MNPVQRNTPPSGEQYDLAVCYRIYPKVSGRTIFGFKNKLSLVRLSLETFREALGRTKAKIWVLLDNCPVEYEKLVGDILGLSPQLILLGGEGNERTFARQIDLLAAQDASDLVYFAEDDYLYLPGSLEESVAFMKEHADVDFLTLYDHPDYRKMYIHRIHPRVRTENDRCWRTVTSTCLTFMARRQALKETGEVFTSFARKNSDLGLWMAITKNRIFNPWSCLRCLGDGLFVSASFGLAWRHSWRQIIVGRRRALWSPLPTLATHMSENGLAAGVDWEAVFGARANTLKHSYES